MITIKIDLSKDNLILVCNALNELLEALDDWEFESRVGRTKYEVEAFRQEMLMKVAILE